MELLPINELVEDSIRMNTGAMDRHKIQIVRELTPTPPVSLDKHKVLQILVNLIRNAKCACDESGRTDKQIVVRVSSTEEMVAVTISDNGVGIAAENLTRIFSHGFTTRAEGHGFGLHSGALAAKEMGGRLLASSEGPGKGAAFTLEIPRKRTKINP
jgi:signal transduction histidine kinase